MTIASILLAAVCINPTTGDCLPYTGSCPDGYTMNTMFSTCPSATPRPTFTPTPKPSPTPAVTPTPTPTAVPARIVQFLSASSLGYTYVQGCTLIAGVLWCSGGVCCPGIGDGIGECVFSIDYNLDPPKFREWWCSYRDTTEMWETGLPQVAQSDRFKWVVTGGWTRRPAVPSRQGEHKAKMVFGFNVNSLTEPFFSWAHSVSHGLFPGMGEMLIWPQGILDLNGVRYLYAQTTEREGQPFYIRRWMWPDGASVAYWDAQFVSAPQYGGFSGIAVDADGSLVTVVDEEVKATAGASAMRITVKPMWWPSPSSNLLTIARSKDDGRTWEKTNITVKAPAGRTLWGCGWAHKSGGGALQPVLLLCNIGTGKGPDVIPSDWNAAYVAWPGAAVPTNFGKLPKNWRAP